MGQRQVLEAKQKAKDMGVELKESEREAKLSRFGEDFSVGEVTGQMGDAMSNVQERIDANKAKIAVSNDMNRESLAEAKDDELQQQAKADAILAEFAKK